MLRQRHVVRLETRPANIEGKGAVRAARAGHQRPAYAARSHHRRRGPQRRSARHAAGDEHRPRRQPDDDPRQQPARRAVSSGYDGRDGESEHPRAAIRQQIASAVNLIVQVSRMPDGTRKVTSISEITGMEGDVITMQEIFVFERTGIDARRQGHRACSGRPASGRSAANAWPRPARCRRTCSSTSNRSRQAAKTGRRESRDGHGSERVRRRPRHRRWACITPASCGRKTSSNALRKRLKTAARTSVARTAAGEADRTSSAASTSSKRCSAVRVGLVKPIRQRDRPGRVCR